MDSSMTYDLLVTALEGGSNYWYDLNDDDAKTARAYKNQYLVDNILAMIEDGRDFRVHDLEEPDTELGVISTANIERGYDLLREKYPQIMQEIEEGDFDAGDADVWFQLVVMGELVFG